MKNENFITIFGWMVNELRLKGTELLVYAIIYGFSQDCVSEYKGSQNYIAEWCNVDRITVNRVLKNLVKKGLIEKTDIILPNRQKMVTYRANKNATGCNKMLHGVCKNVTGGGNKMLHNNITDNNKHKDSYSTPKKNRFNDIPKRQYDFDELERRLKANQ